MSTDDTEQPSLLNEPLLQHEESSEQNSVADWESKRWGITRASYLLLAATMLLDSIEFSILMPTLYQFLKSTKRDPDADVTNALGLVLSSFSAASLLSKPILGWLGDKTAMTPTLAWSTLVAAVGNILYSFSAYLALELFPEYEMSGELFILLARILSGVGCANTTLVFAYVARAVKPSERTSKISSLSLIKILGVLVGPAVTFITSSIDVKIGDFWIDYRNAPGFFIAILQLFTTVALFTFLKEPLSYEEADRMDEVRPHRDECETATQAVVESGCCAKFSAGFKLFFSSGIFISFFVILYYNLQMACLEAFATPTAVEVYGWSSMTVSLQFLLFTFVAVVGNVVVMLLSGKVEDTTFLLVGAIFAIIAPVIMKFTFYWDMSAAPTLLVFSLLVAPVPFVFGPGRSIFTRLIEGSHSQGLLSAWLSVTSSIGGILGPLFVGWFLELDKPVDGNLHKPFAPQVSNMFVAMGTINVIVNFGSLYFYRDKLRNVVEVVQQETVEHDVGP